MEVYRTKDGTVAKYVHDDGSETAIKSVPTCACGEFTLGEHAHSKYAIFISSSVGCPVDCKFCYLTVKKCPYHKLGIESVLSNVKEAIDSEIEFNPSLKEKYVKISWMGMGDALFEIPMVTVATIEIVDAILHQRQAKGLDGVDIGTSIPLIDDKHIDQLDKLKNSLSGYKRNPNNTDGRSIIRIFYSLHSADDTTRHNLIPKSKPLYAALITLNKFNKKGFDIILHQMFLRNINDSDGQIDTIINLCLEHPTFELRVLRFNKCPDAQFDETDRFIKIIDKLKQSVPKLKFQVSVGSEILSACGQFIISKVK